MGRCEEWVVDRFRRRGRGCLIRLRGRGNRARAFRRLSAIGIKRSGCIVYIPCLRRRASRVRRIIVLGVITSPRGPRNSLLLPRRGRSVLSGTCRLFMREGRSHFS